jgi:aminodeoxyfutalosine deaminase
MTVEAFVDALPKVELHVHLEGAVRPETLLTLAGRQRSSGIPDSLDELREFYRFRDFDHFVEVYYAVCDNLRSAEDFALIVAELGESLAAQRVRYAEVTFTPYNHTRRGLAAETVFEGVEQGRAQALADSGVELRWCTDIPGEFGPEAGLQTARMVLAAREAGRLDGAVSFGLGGPEVGFPRRLFAEAFAIARDAGLHSAPMPGRPPARKPSGRHWSTSVPSASATGCAAWRTQSWSVTCASGACPSRSVPPRTCACRWSRRSGPTRCASWSTRGWS